MQALLPEWVDGRYPIRSNEDDIWEAAYVEEAVKEKLPKKNKHLKKYNGVTYINLALKCLCVSKMCPPARSSSLHKKTIWRVELRVKDDAF